MSKRVLGKGLSALLGTDAATVPTPNAGQKKVLGAAKPSLAPKPTLLDGREAMMLNVDELVANPHQPRKHMDEEKLEELAASIRENGVLQPVLVRRVGKGFELVAGERRVRASRLAGLQQLPALVCTMDDEESLRLALLENIQREDLNPLEEAEAYEAMCEQLGATHQEVAQMLGKSRSTVSNMVRLLKLGPEIRDLVAGNELSMGHARALLGLEDPAERLRIARRVLRDGLSVRALEELLQGGRRDKRPRKKAPEETADRQAIHAYEERVRHHFGVPSTIHRKGKKGKIELSFFSDDELLGILQKLGVDTQL